MTFDAFLTTFSIREWLNHKEGNEQKLKEAYTELVEDNLLETFIDVLTLLKNQKKLNQSTFWQVFDCYQLTPLQNQLKALVEVNQLTDETLAILFSKNESAIFPSIFCFAAESGQLNLTTLKLIANDMDSVVRLDILNSAKEEDIKSEQLTKMALQVNDPLALLQSIELIINDGDEANLDKELPFLYQLMALPLTNALILKAGWENIDFVRMYEIGKQQQPLAASLSMLLNDFSDKKLVSDNFYQNPLAQDALFKSSIVIAKTSSNWDEMNAFFLLWQKLESKNYKITDAQKTMLQHTFIQTQGFSGFCNYLWHTGLKRDIEPSFHLNYGHYLYRYLVDCLMTCLGLSKPSNTDNQPEKNANLGQNSAFFGTNSIDGNQSGRSSSEYDSSSEDENSLISDSGSDESVKNSF